MVFGCNSKHSRSNVYRSDITFEGTDIMYKVIFHVDEITKASLALNNIRNLIADIGEQDLKVELLTNSEGIKMLLKAEKQYEPPLLELRSKKVTFAVCSNAMKALGITEDLLHSFAEVVPSGVGELVKRQSEGYAYIKP